MREAGCGEAFEVFEATGAKGRISWLTLLALHT